MVAIAVAALFAASCWPAAAQDALERIKRDGVLKVVNSGVYPPFESMEDGKLVGFDIDLSNLIAAQLGVKADVKAVDFKGLIPTLKSGKADIIISGFTFTPERAQQVAFSKPYYPTAMAVIMRDNMKPLSAKDELQGKSIGAEMGTTGDREARGISGANVKTYDTLMLAMLDLQNGRLDAVISTLPPATYLINRNFKSLKTTFRYSEGYVAMAMRPEDASLVAAVDNALETLKKNGQLRELEIRWFGEASN